MTTVDSASASEPTEDLSSSSLDAAPKLDLAFKEGETIKVNINVCLLASSG